LELFLILSKLGFNNIRAKDAREHWEKREDYMKLTKFESSYVETMFWSSIDDDTGEPMDSLYSVEDLHPETLEQIRKDCAEFQKILETLEINETESKIAHDFWLTRNRHGAGFWDGDYPKKLGEELTKISQGFGELCLYRGDDGKLYF
jgi:hypothetical protein